MWAGILLLIIYLAWKSFFFANAVTEDKKDAPGCGCLVFFVVGGMVLLAALLNM
jgi:hypothetical protein